MDVRHDQAAERNLLAAAMVEKNVMADVTLAPGEFWDPRHEVLWRILQGLYRSGQPTDSVSVVESMPPSGVDGITPLYVSSLIAETTVTRGTAEHYARIVSGLARLREVQRIATELHQAAAEATWDTADKPLAAARAAIDQAAAASANVGVRSFSDALEDAIKEWESPQDTTAQPTGWGELDDYLNGGWKPGQVTILGARPAVGKSLIAGCATVAAHTYGAGFFSLEMTERELVSRMVATEKGINLGHIESRDLTDEDWDRIIRLRGEAPDWRVFIEAKPRRSMEQIRATLRTWTRQHPVPLVVIDYLQLVSPADPRELRERQVSRIAEDCKALAKDFHCHVLALAQVNRGATTRDDKRPTMSDLRESGGIEANADNIILLHRDDEAEDMIQFVVAKNRHGRTGTIELVWRPHTASANGEHGGYPFGMPGRAGW